MLACVCVCVGAGVSPSMSVMMPQLVGFLASSSTSFLHSSGPPPLVQLRDDEEDEGEGGEAKRGRWRKRMEK